MLKNKPHALIFAALLLCIGFHGDYFAQQTGAPAARKVDEFGDILITDIIARLDAFAIELQNDPTARAFLVVYRSRRDLPGLSVRYADRMKSYLVYSRGIAPERIVGIDGGAASCLVQEIWVVPPGATPQIRSDAYPQHYDDTDVARKFDAYYYPLLQDRATEYDYMSEAGSSLEAYAAALRLTPRAQAYIIIYPQFYVQTWSEETSNGKTRRRSNVFLDPPGAAKKMLAEVRRELVNKHKIPASRVRVVNGGYRRSRQIELWIVPRGEHAPIATPNAFPRSRVRR